MNLLRFHVLSAFSLWLSGAAAVFCIGCSHTGGAKKAPLTLQQLTVQNLTHDSMAGRMVRAAFQERCSVDPAFRLPGRSGRPLKVTAVVTRLENRSVAKADVREGIPGRRDSDHYQTVLYRVALHADVTVTADGSETPVLKRRYVGLGNLPRHSDHDIPLRAACRDAAADLASQALDDVAALQP